MKKLLMILVIALISTLVLGAKGCKANTRADVIEHLPELNKVADKFEIEKKDDRVVLITYDHLAFQEMITILKEKTPMNKPVLISSFRETHLESAGEFKMEYSVKEVFPARENLKPYFGRIYIFDGYWDAIEFDAFALFSNEDTNIEDTVLVTEYFYTNETVYKTNEFSPQDGVLSSFDKSFHGKREAIKGDGSTSDVIMSEFER
jgi:hypothetical protein